MILQILDTIAHEVCDGVCQQAVYEGQIKGFLVGAGVVFVLWAVVKWSNHRGYDGGH